MSCLEDCAVLSAVTLGGRHIADGAVAMLGVVLSHELGGPAPGVVQRRESAGGELGAILCGAEQRFGIGVVVRHPRARVRRLDAQPLCVNLNLDTSSLG